MWHLPCVVSRQPGNRPNEADCHVGGPELIAHGVSSLTFPPGDWASLTRALEQMLESADLRARLAAERQRRVEAEPLWSEPSLRCLPCCSPDPIPESSV
jgi:hypothetical protein